MTDVAAGVLTSFVCVLVLGPAVAVAQTPTHPSADRLAIEWGVETNFVDDGARFRSRLALTNRGTTALADSGWTLYFNFLRDIDPGSVTGGVEITRINGSFYRLEPRAEFESLSPDDTHTITFEATGAAIKRVDAPAGFYVVFTDAEGEPKAPAPIDDVTVAPFTRPEQIKRIPTEGTPMPTPANRHQANQALSTLAADAVGRIVPTPVSTERRDGAFSLSATSTIRYEDGLQSEAQHLASGLAAALGTRPALSTDADDPAIVLRRADVSVPSADTVQDEAYRLTVDPSDGIEIVGTSAAGVFYGVQSLQSWLPVAAYEEASPPLSVPAVRVTDAPRFDHRGLHLDVARNFQSAETVKRLLDVMATYKLNVFHFHLTDDEGWRLAIDGLSELTEVGGRRGHTLDERDHLVPSYGSGPDPAPSASPGSGWYTQDEYVDILRYARERHIEVVPEIDVPGHARAAIQAMETRRRRLQQAGDTAAAHRHRLQDPRDTSEYESVQGWTDNTINVCQRSTYRFLTTVIDQVQALHERAGAPLTTVHVGGDEVPDGVWTGSPLCNRYVEGTAAVDSVGDLFDHFLHRMRDTLAARGLTMGGWEEVALTDEGSGHDASAQPDPSFVGQNVRPYVWSNVWGNGQEDHAYGLANAGYDVVMAHASNFYFDMTHGKHPADPGFYWAGYVSMKDPFAFIPFDLYKTPEHNSMGHPIDPSMQTEFESLDDDARARILGLQGQLWGELLRSADRMEYMAVPRLMGLAERAWAPQPEWATLDDRERLQERRDEAWSAFANRLGQRELPRLSLRRPDWSYRLPAPGAVIEDGTLRASVALPGLPIRYTTDGTTPTPDSRRYDGPVDVPGDATVRLRTFDGHGRGSRTVTVSP